MPESKLDSFETTGFCQHGNEPSTCEKCRTERNEKGEAARFMELDKERVELAAQVRQLQERLGGVMRDAEVEAEKLIEARRSKGGRPDSDEMKAQLAIIRMWKWGHDERVRQLADLVAGRDKNDESSMRNDRDFLGWEDDDFAELLRLAKEEELHINPCVQY